MKKYIGIVLIAVSLSFGGLFAFAQTAEEHIEHFDVTAKINTDATVDVRESIVYDFGPNERHGIFREIPVKYQASYGNQSVTLSNILVTDEKGIAYNFDTERNGNNLQIKIGDPDQTITGVKTYIISYKADRVVGYFKNIDELYWNATGNEWQVPISAASATIYLPKPFTKDQIQSSCYWGEKGSTSECPIVPIAQGDNLVAVNFAINNLQPFEGLTIATGFPKGVVYEPTTTDRIINLIKDNWILGLPLFVFLFMLNVWWRKGRDPQGRGTIVPEYDAPENLTPLEMSVLRRQSVQNKDISAQIIYLATHGFLKINRTEEKGFLSKTVDYTLTKTKNISETTNLIDKELLTALYHDDTGNTAVNTLKLSTLKNTFYTKLPAIKKAAVQSVVQKGYYPADPQKIMGKYIGFAAVFFVLIWIFGMAEMLTGVALGSIVASGIIIIAIFAFVMPKVTAEGAIMRERIEGLKMYIKVAEEDRIKFHNAPAKNPELFEKLLPFAMVFGLEKEWAKQFKGLLTTPPSWYSDSSGHAFNAVVFSNNLSSFSSAASSTLSSTPGGSSGSGGGGFSGGGGGGGGGGSW